MIAQIIPIPSLKFEKVHYYTIRLGDKTVSEFRDFQQRMGAIATNITELAEINRHIEKIGTETGAYERHFRHEGAADGLPPPYHKFIEAEGPGNYGLRLYCIRLSPSVVILLNGDRKTALKVNDCEKCKPHFTNAVKISLKLNNAIAENYVYINNEEKEIEVDEDFELEL